VSFRRRVIQRSETQSNAANPPEADWGLKEHVKERDRTACFESPRSFGPNRTSLRMTREPLRRPQDDALPPRASGAFMLPVR
jgi:hypothetical protein